MDNLNQLETIAQHPLKFEEHLARAAEAFFSSITEYGLKTIGAIIILVAGWVLAGLLQNAVLRAGRRSPRFDVTIFTFSASILRYLVLTFAVLAVLENFGVKTTSFITVLGAAGLAIGLALQGTLSHVASGMMLIVFRPFRVGDQIEAAGVAGAVRSITLFVTEIDTVDNVRIILPNGLIWSQNIKNFSANDNRRTELRFQVSYADDLDKAIALVKAVLQTDSRVLPTPAATVGVHSMTVDGVILAAQFWLQSRDMTAMPFDINKAVKTAFDRAGITISFPQKAIPAPATPA